LFLSGFINYEGRIGSIRGLTVGGVWDEVEKCSSCNSKSLSFWGGEGKGTARRWVEGNHQWMCRVVKNYLLQGRVNSCVRRNGMGKGGSVTRQLSSGEVAYSRNGRTAYRGKNSPGKLVEVLPAIGPRPPPPNLRGGIRRKGKKGSNGNLAFFRGGGRVEEW